MLSNGQVMVTGHALAKGGPWLALIACGAFVAAGCRDGRRLRIWPVDALVKVFPDNAPGTNEAGDREWLVARNGHVSLQFAVRSARGAQKLSVEVDPPQRDGAALEARARWVDYVPVGSNPPGTPFDEVIRPAPALFPDPLREEFPVELPPATTHAIWLTIHAPPGAEPGLYRGAITVRGGEQRLATASYAVRVMAAAVPAEPSLQVTNWFDLSLANLRRFYKIEQEYSEPYWQLLENLGRVMAEHRQNVILTPVSELAEPSLAGGAIRYDFSRLDRWVAVFEKAGVIGTIEGGHLLGRSGGYHSPLTVPAAVVEGGRIVRKNLDPDDPRAAAYLRGFLGQLYAHLKQRGWEKRYIQHVHDEPHDREAPVYERYARLIRESLPGIPTIDAVGLDQDIRFFAGVCDIWVPVLGSFDHRMDLIRGHLAKGGQAWYYTCIVPQGRYLNRFIDLPLLKVRLLHWFNFRHNFTGFLHWGGNFWGPRPFENVQTVINQNRTLLPAGDNAIVYPDPARHSVLSSIRLEAMREGIEDYELLRQLERVSPVEARKLAAEAIPHINDYVRDVKTFRRLQRRLLETLAGGER
jgi:hypothetical protein